MRILRSSPRQEFFRPIVTPFELEMALGVVPAWSGRYILDFEKVIAEVRDSITYGDGETTEATEEDGRDEPHFSLITGKLVTSKRYGDRGEENNGKGNAGGVLVPRNQDTTLGNLIGSAAGEHGPILFIFQIIEILLFIYQANFFRPVHGKALSRE